MSTKHSRTIYLDPINDQAVIDMAAKINRGKAACLFRLIERGMKLGLPARLDHRGHLVTRVLRSVDFDTKLHHKLYVQMFDIARNGSACGGPVLSDLINYYISKALDAAI